jgi:hypothetical protein
MNAQSTKSRKWLALLCVGIVSTAGCFTRRPPKATFGRNWALQPPVVHAALGAQLDAPPEMAVENMVAPADLAVMRSAPAKPRVAAAPAAEPAKAEKQPEPGIAPEFNSQELEAAKAETQRNLDAMEKNLTLAWGRTLNTTQQDLMSKVRGFADNAREAMKTGDWVRAKTLSKKAQVLSDELAAGL